jgi:hypothetical protein
MRETTMSENQTTTPGNQTTAPGNLVVVGSGIHVGHITLEAQGWIRNADKVLYCVADPVTERWIKKNARDPEPEDLMSYYPKDPETDPPTPDTFAMMASRIVHWVNAGSNVCAVFYGHPSIIVHPARMVTAWACRYGVNVRMIPGISALDCLLADRNINPGDTGLQMFEAGDFLDRLKAGQDMRRPTLDPYCHVVFWQIGLLPSKGYTLQDLYKALAPYYDKPATQGIFHYQRPQLPIFSYFAPAQSLCLANLPSLPTTGASMLYIPPKGYVDTDANWNPVTLSEDPTTPGAPDPELEKVAEILYKMAQDPESLAKYGARRSELMAGATLAPDIETTLQSDNVMAILAEMEKLVPPKPLKSAPKPAQRRTAQRRTVNISPHVLAGAVQLRAAADNSVKANGIW